MIRIIELLNEHRDKVNHFVVGQAVALLGLYFWWWLSIVAVVLVAVGKEVWDSKGNGTVEVLDALATIAGGVLIVGLYLL